MELLDKVYRYLQNEYSQAADLNRRESLHFAVAIIRQIEANSITN